MAAIPRFMVAAPSSGAGKTTVTLALLSALKRRGLDPVSFKCGPDYIDPMFHRAVLGIPSYNLDLFFTPAETVRGLFAGHAAGRGAAVIEGVMGYYDGSGTGTEASSYALAAATETPVILVVSARGAFLSIAATIKGFKDFRSDSRIAGVILNDCSKPLFDMTKAMLERETGLPVLGHLPRLEDCAIGSRHLGLVTAQEIGDLQQKLEKLGDAAEAAVDIGALLEIAAAAPSVGGSLPEAGMHLNSKPRIAVARDEAFCFYYEDNLNLLTRAGAELVPFSPLRDSGLPDGVSGVYLGGGYPELYAGQLSQNAAMLDSVRRAVSGGMPAFAECGGYLYLHESLEDDSGQAFPMAGVIAGRGFKTSRLQRFGYVTLTAREDTMLCAAGASVPAHEFHYWDSTVTGGQCTAAKPRGKSWPCVVATETLFAGFPHLYFYGNPTFAENFVKAAARYAERAV
ncbi:hydrogenobyrinic acid a,c-diamide synthase (glutamine-hydrolysing) [Sporobacter termitidis DSM 10068]|uniref:Cobyrinate a,c-diamide synthase n=1 Tax=Sporobacter termitidis DSM 10068 TaxID=1123282 RepID=A0A1M5ZCG0_9FIRM|nr:cobyrinate a,c-diamide synthase [Sporobacter termitidis]SHI21623.1 hydrogenobyrinic acid a,c-diamide synthase (glutamine-hydrolysing) [Sporobacter termitidis DSM 10068]